MIFISSTEKEVLEQKAKGYSAIEIAEYLDVTPKTVFSHLYNVSRRIKISIGIKIPHTNRKHFAAIYYSRHPEQFKVKTKRGSKRAQRLAQQIRLYWNNSDRQNHPYIRLDDYSSIFLPDFMG